MLLELFVIATASSFATRVRYCDLQARSILLLLAATLALASCDRQSPQQEQAVDSRETAYELESIPDRKAGVSGLSGKLEISKRGEAMPDVIFFKPDNTETRLSDFKGKPLLVNLWATWCGPCVVELPTLEALAEREEKRLNVVVVSQDTQKAGEVAPFLAERGFKRLKPYVDPENNLGFSFATGVIPTTILYDAQGKEVWRVIGGTDWNGSRIAAMMEDTLQGK